MRTSCCCRWSFWCGSLSAQTVKSEVHEWWRNEYQYQLSDTHPLKNVKFEIFTLDTWTSSPPLPFSNGNFVCCARIVMKRLVNYYWDFSSVRESSSCHQFWLLINCRQRVRAGQFLESLTSFKCDYISRAQFGRDVNQRIPCLWHFDVKIKDENFSIFTLFSVARESLWQ